MRTQSKRKKYTKHWIFLALLVLFNLALSACSYADGPEVGTIISTEGTPAQSTEETEPGVPETAVGGAEENDVKKVEIDDSVSFPEVFPEFADFSGSDGSRR